MATKEVKICDVYGTHKDVETYCVWVARGEGLGEDADALKTCKADLSPRAVKRLIHFVEKGLNPTTKGEAELEKPTAIVDGQPEES